MGSPDSFKETGFNINLTPGVIINIKNGLALNLGIGSITYNSNKLDDISQRDKNLMISFGRGASFGVTKNFTL